MSFGDFLENLGFTDIYENTDHTFNATKDGSRYFHLYLSAVGPATDSTIIKDDSGSVAVVEWQIPLCECEYIKHEELKEKGKK